MRTYVSFSFDDAELPGGYQGLLRTAEIGEDEFEVLPYFKDALVTVDLPEGDARIPRLLELLKHHGKDVLEGSFDRYTDEELDNARLLLLEPAHGEPAVHGGCGFGTAYDLKGACPSCCAGARQSSAMYIEGWNDGPHWILEGHRGGHTPLGELLIDDGVAAELKAVAPAGLVLNQVCGVMLDTEQQVELAWKQLSADRILPPMSPLTENLAWSDHCAICTRSGYMACRRTHVFYRKRDIEGAGDVNLSWECKYYRRVDPNLRECMMPVPFLLVTPKVMRVLRAAGVTEFEWIPIRVVDE